MRITTWNVNSVRQRLDHLVAVLREEAPDVLCLQELKCQDDAFPRAEVEAAGYQVTTHGQKGFNGVAILTPAATPALTPKLRRVGLYSIESGHKLCLQLLEDPEPPTAILCGNDVIALGALNAAAAAKVRVPEELSIVGFDDLRSSAWETIGLSTVHQPIDRMAEAAARMLVERIERTYKGPSRDEVFPVGLVERGTTAPPNR